ncbi:MAG: dipeptide epimerase [Chitinophagaceae bacterium]
MPFRLDFKLHELPFKYPFTISKGTKTHQPTLIVRLHWNGLTGWGEAPAITYYDVTTEKMAAVLEQKKMFIEKFAFTEPERYWHYLHHLLPNDPFVVCALDMAAWDIFSQLKRMPLYRLWGTEIADAPVSDYTIGIASIDEMVRKMKENSWPVYKIKLGTPEDISIMQALRKETDAVFRVDANAGWKLEEALRILPVLEELGVELIEQPLAKDDWEGMKVLYEQSPISLIADESCVFEKDVALCHGHFHGINIKLTKCSGITPARRMIKQARELGLKVMIGSMNECSIGTAAIAHLSPQADYIDADGPLLLAEDPGKGGVKFEGYKCVPVF